MKKAAAIILSSALVFTLMGITGCSKGLSKAYYLQHPMSSERVARVWGEPVDVKQLENGIEKRVYKIQNPVTEFKYRYFMIKDKTVICSGISDIGATSATKAEEDIISFVPSDLSMAYYKKFPVKAEKLAEVWGEPIFIQKTEDGMEKKAYELHDPHTDYMYRYFLLRDGMVVASRLSTGKGIKDKSSAGAHKGIEINEISNAYYAKHPKTAAEVEKVWDKPVFVQKGKGGMEKRIYRINNHYLTGFQFRFFIIKNGMVVSSGILDTLDLTK